MKYVSKELYEQTVHLELKYNTVVFKESSFGNGRLLPVDHFMRFSEIELPSSKRDLLRKVSLQPRSVLWTRDQHASSAAPKELAYQLQETLRLCRAYNLSTALPRLRLEYCLPRFEQTPEDLQQYCDDLSFTPELGKAQILACHVFGSAKFVRLWLRGENLDDSQRFICGQRLALEYRQSHPAEQYQVPDFKVLPVAVSQVELEQGLDLLVRRWNAVFAVDSEDEIVAVIASWRREYRQWQENGL